MGLAVGIDLVKVSTIAQALEEHGQHYLRRIYTDTEVEQCTGPNGVEPLRLAARFAAKEATIKALPGGGEGIALTTIEVRSDPETGEVSLQLSGRAAEVAAEAGIGELALSLTHEPDYAAAAVVVGP
jgi:holo-[acyl-carrier protein] synthase